MLLRPRKTLYKSSHKKRSSILPHFKNLISHNHNNNQTQKLSYGQYGLLNLSQNYLFYNKYVFKIKLYLKKTVRRSNITNRHLWIKVFPHIPVTKKVIGSRMGKGKGKPSTWAVKVPSKSIFIELKNVRYGRVNFFLKQVIFKLPGNHLIVSKYNSFNMKSVFFRKSYNKYDYFF